jgi:hypothetical protein
VASPSSSGEATGHRCDEYPRRWLSPPPETLALCCFGVPPAGDDDKAFVIEPEEEMLGARGSPTCLAARPGAIIDSHSRA